MDYIEIMLGDFRIVQFTPMGDNVIATAIPVAFKGGPIPPEWRAEAFDAEAALNAI